MIFWVEISFMLKWKIFDFKKIVVIIINIIVPPLPLWLVLPTQMITLECPPPLCSSKCHKITTARHHT